MMKRFGSIPVPAVATASDFRVMMRRTKEALDDGISIIAFPEGTRTVDGRVGPFQKGAFLIAQKYGFPIVPMTIKGSFEFNRKGSWMLNPSRIKVVLHDTIDTRGLCLQDVDLLVERAHQIVSAPLEDPGPNLALGVEESIHPRTRTDQGR
jgi:1-acyl-sn-glycerol-3-phosphate acyltransferase